MNYFQLVDCSYINCEYYERKTLCSICARNKALTIKDRFEQEIATQSPSIVLP